MTSARVDGVDLSHFQSGPLDFRRAKDAGVKFVFHKATEGLSFKDQLYPSRRSQVAGVGIPFGAYHFARPGRSNGRTQARYFLSVAQVRPGDMRPMLDLEDRGGLTRAQLSAWVKDFVDEVVAQTGVKPFIYTPFDLDSTFDCPLWVARYSDAMSAPRVPAPWKTYSVWQFSNGVFGSPTSVAGIGHCDLNTLNGNPAELVKMFRIPFQTSRDTTRQPVAPTPELTIVQHNIWRENTHALEDLLSITHSRPHLVGLNEAKTFGSAVHSVPGYQAIQLGNGPERQNPILVRADIKVLDKGVRMMCKATGPSPARGATWVAYRFHGHHMAHVQTHFNSHVQHGDRPWALPRVGQYIQHWRNLRKLVKDLRAQGYRVTVGTDANWTAGSNIWPWSPTNQFRLLRMRTQWARTDLAPAGGTHGSRRIDYLAHSPRELHIARERAFRTHSDHRAVEVTYRLVK